MYSLFLGSQFDIHTGGIDLKFLHEDNKIAQSQVFYGADA
jgi:cysteinyl-tRNA synthetase